MQSLTPAKRREPVFRALELIAHGLVRAQGLDLTFTGVQNIPSTGGAVLTINHTGYMDFLPAALGVYRAGRRTRFMIKSEVMDIAIMRFLVNHTSTVPVDRSEGAQAYTAAVDALRAGEIVAVYPEATISRSFELKAFKTGAVRMAAEARVPIVPAIVWGAHRQWTKTGKRNMGRSKLPVSVRFGLPLAIDSAVDPSAETARLRDAMSTMLHEVQDAYGEHPKGEFWVPARLGGSAPTPEEAAVIETEEAQRKAEERARKASSRKDGHR
ncbi:1-acyl-sn-glycerol-3-phosphate acyltransferase [Gordonia bronchialis]|jgi:1-acyl-sn-glycerol-3-phosphate acyltransferase|uniref:lysophospholipid acyltransferase family protein n=1 Tax=Gordonia bronchialis TaxID=2054 RepID=UPI001CBAB6B0|nr:lysophospholipid acyltransferase family protein [Gordonia bronchialis]UAK37090.1 1-acyl-sn-glycerol-3-phosphate acyltransferase [Gordonia bronchialis]